MKKKPICGIQIPKKKKVTVSLDSDLVEAIQKTRKPFEPFSRCLNRNLRNIFIR